MADNIPPPNLSLPPEIQALVNEIRRTNESIKREQRSKEIDHNAIFITKKFNDSIHTFINSYAALSDRMSTSFGKNISLVAGLQDMTIAETKKSNSILEEMLALHHSIFEIMVSNNKRSGANTSVPSSSLRSVNNKNFFTRGSREPEGERVKKETITRDKLSIRLLTKIENKLSNSQRANGEGLSRVNKSVLQAIKIWKEARDKRQRLEKDEKAGEAHKDRLARLKAIGNDYESSAFYPGKNGIVNRMVKSIGEKVFGNKVSGLASLLGEIALGPGKWIRVAKKAAGPALLGAGIFGLISFMGYQMLFGTIGQTFDLYRKEGSSIAWAAAKTLGEVIKDSVMSILKGLKIIPEESDAEALKKQKEEAERRINAELNAYKEELKKAGIFGEKQEELLKKKTEALKKISDAELQWAEFTAKNINGLYNWFMPESKEQIDKIKKVKEILEKMIPEAEKDTNDKIREIINEKFKLKRELTPLLEKELKEKLTEKERLLKEELTTTINTLDEQQKAYEKYLNNLKKELNRANSIINLYGEQNMNKLVQDTKDLLSWFEGYMKELDFKNFKVDAEREVEKTWSNWFQRNFGNQVEILVKMLADVTERIINKITPEAYGKVTPKTDNPIEDEKGQIIKDRYKDLLKKSSFSGEIDQRGISREAMAIDNLSRLLYKASIVNQTTAVSAPTVINNSNATAHNVKSDVYVSASVSPINVPWTSFNHI